MRPFPALGLLSAIPLAVAIALAAPAAAADYEAGQKAYAAADYKRTMVEWRPLAETGDARAQVGVARMYELGQGVSENPVEAIRWYRMAADQGHAGAQFRLGVIYDDGRGVPVDYKEAARWYRKAAEQGVATAQFNLGVMYEKGQGLPQSFQTARDWYELAADQGNGDARNNLGALFLFGRGVEKDLVMAHMWFNLAASAGHRTAEKNRDDVAGRLNLKQIEKAQALAAQQYAVEGRTGWFDLSLEDVRAIQAALAAAGYNPGPIDGERGPLTESALAAFQSANDLPTGEPDLATLKALGVRE